MARRPAQDITVGAVFALALVVFALAVMVVGQTGAIATGVNVDTWVAVGRALNNLPSDQLARLESEFADLPPEALLQLR